MLLCRISCSVKSLCNVHVKYCNHLLAVDMAGVGIVVCVWLEKCQKL